jgi:HEAT repeat protein
MSAQVKRLTIALGVLIVLMAGIYRWSMARQDAKPQTIASHKPQTSKAKGQLSPSSKPALLRYDPLKDPRMSAEASAIYYQRREQMIREQHGDGQIEKPLKVLEGRTGTKSDLITAIGSVTRNGSVRAIPYLLKLLEHQELLVRWSAAEGLCSFGDTRGFDYILQHYGLVTGADWASMFNDVFVQYKPPGYNDALIKLISEVKREDEESRKLAALEISTVLAEMGEPASLDVLLPSLKQYPPLSAARVLALRNVNDPRVTRFAMELMQSGKSSAVRQAAVIVLAARGDQAAQTSIVEAAKRLIDLPQPLNADGTYKPGMNPGSVGAVTPAWDSDAMLALERGMEFVPAAQAVPVLKQIAISANNVRFSKIAIIRLAKIGNEAARGALWETAQALQKQNRVFESSIFEPAGQALTLFDDETSLSMARTLFGGYQYGFEEAKLFSESKGWDGLFK